MIEVTGKCYLKQNKEIIPHINLDLIMKYVNKLHRTRRVYRDFELLSNESKKEMFSITSELGGEGEYYWKEDFPETIPDINNKGKNPSLLMPFYIEKENNNYILKCLENPKGNNLNSIISWINFLYSRLFFHIGIESEGQFKVNDFELKKKANFKINKNEISYRSTGMNGYYLISKKEEIIEVCNKSKFGKKTLYPYFLEDISKNIESKKLNKNFNFEP